MRGIWATENRPMTAALVSGLLATLFVTLVPTIQFAYDNPQLHLVLETAEGLVAALLSYLIVGRFRTTGQLHHLALTLAFAMLAAVNLLLAAVPIVALGSRPTGALIWAAAGFRIVALATLCLAAFSGRRLAPQGRALLLFVASSVVGAVVVVSLFALSAEALFADAIDPSLAPEASRRPRLEGHPAVLVMQLVALALLAAAAIKFFFESRDGADELLRWLAAGAALGAFARIHYFLFPSLYSNDVYTGDLLRLGSYLFDLIGAARGSKATLRCWSCSSWRSPCSPRRR